MNLSHGVHHFLSYLLQKVLPKYLCINLRAFNHFFIDWIDCPIELIACIYLDPIKRNLIAMLFQIMRCRNNLNKFLDKQNSLDCRHIKRRRIDVNASTSFDIELVLKKIINCYYIITSFRQQEEEPFSIHASYNMMLFGIVKQRQKWKISKINNITYMDKLLNKNNILNFSFLL